MKKTIYVLALIIAAFLLIVLLDRKETDITVRIGVLAPLSGRFAGYGEDIKAAVEVAKNKLTKEGVNNIQVVYEDSGADPKIALAAARKLIDIDNVSVIIAGPGSTANLAVAPQMEENEIVFFAISSTPKLNESGEYIFKLQPDITYETEALAGHLISHDLEKVAVVYDFSSDTHTEASTHFSTMFAERGGEAVSEGFDGKAIDFRTQLTSLISHQPDALYVLANEKSSGMLVKQARELGFNKDIFGFSGITGTEFFTGAGAYAEGVIITDQPFSCDGVDAMKEYCAEFHKIYSDRIPLKYGAHAYDIVMTIAHLDNQSKERIREEFTSRTHSGVSGTYFLDAKGNITNMDFILRVVKGGVFTDLIE